MRGNETFYLLFGICGFMFGLLTYTHDNLEYKNYPRNSSCTGDCYVKYVEENGTPAEIEKRKQAAAATDPFSSIKGLWSGCAACHGQKEKA